MLNSLRLGVAFEVGSQNAEEFVAGEEERDDERHQHPRLE